MDLLLFALSIGLPLIKLLLFPARTMGRGGGWTLVGAAMIVCLMMAIFLGVQQLTAPPAPGTATAASAEGNDLQLPDLDKLGNLL